MTLCFMLCRFNFLLLYFVYNVAHFKRRNSRGRAKMEKKRGRRREYKHFNASVVMLVFIYLKSMQLVTITVKKSTGGLGLIMLHTGFSL